jgi:hypothetical protein
VPRTAVTTSGPAAPSSVVTTTTRAM